MFRQFKPSQERLLLPNALAARGAFGLTAEGWYTRAEFAAALVGKIDLAEDNHSTEFAQTLNGITCMFHGLPSGVVTVNYRLWLIDWVTNTGAASDVGYAWFTAFGTVSLAASANGKANATVPADHMMAEAITLTPSSSLTSPQGPEEVWATALGGGLPRAYSPGVGSGRRAMLILPDLNSQRSLGVDWTSVNTTLNMSFRKFA